MERHSSKKFHSVVVKELLTKRLISKENSYIFAYWNYNKGALNLFFALEKDKDKDFLRDNIKIWGIKLHFQHLNDYKDTLKLVYRTFKKVENLENNLKGDTGVC